MNKATKTLAALIVAAIAVPSAALAAPSATGGTTATGGTGTVETTKYASTLSGSYSSKADAFKGKLGSGFAVEHEDAAVGSDACTAGRKVEVWKKRTNKPNVLVGSDKTNSTGRWSVSKDSNRGSYYAKVGQKKFLYREYYGIQYYGVCEAAKTSL